MRIFVLSKSRLVGIIVFFSLLISTQFVCADAIKGTVRKINIEQKAFSVSTKECGILNFSTEDKKFLKALKVGEPVIVENIFDCGKTKSRLTIKVRARNTGGTVVVK